MEKYRVTYLDYQPPVKRTSVLWVGAAYWLGFVMAPLLAQFVYSGFIRPDPETMAYFPIEAAVISVLGFLPSSMLASTAFICGRQLKRYPRPNASLWAFLAGAAVGLAWMVCAIIEIESDMAKLFIFFLTLVGPCIFGFPLTTSRSVRREPVVAPATKSTLP